MSQSDCINKIDSLRRQIDRAFESFGLENGPMFRSAFLLEDWRAATRW
jgi:hypothetical protein